MLLQITSDSNNVLPSPIKIYLCAGLIVFSVMNDDDIPVNIVQYFVMDEQFTPSALTSQISGIKQIDDIIPDNWIIKTDFSYNERILEWTKHRYPYANVPLLMGYKDFVLNPDHLFNLIEYEYTNEDLKIFRKEYYYIVNKYYYEYTRMKPDIKNGLEFTKPNLIFEEEYIDRNLEYLR